VTRIARFLSGFGGLSSAFAKTRLPIRLRKGEVRVEEQYILQAEVNRAKQEYVKARLRLRRSRADVPSDMPHSDGGQGVENAAVFAIQHAL
jgi:hypothetical protein